MNIGSGSGYPESALSNFSPNAFVFDGIDCASMEGLLQSFKFKSEMMQAHVCTLVGKKAKFKGKSKKWYKTQTLWWKGVEIKRDSDEYQELLDRAFDALATNAKFIKAILATNNAVLKHTMGKSDISRTVLTTTEFCSRLTKIRDNRQ
jgi:ATP/maltotriose-dependent transcriptional regulator MalT|tara:strand:+ start:155 stop:598 length:444 start_codon:yes stop_codon:yes gene_type:complete